MTKGVLLFCFNTPDVQYHKILERCVALVKQNLKLEITVVTDFATYQKIKPMGFINYKLIEPELGNKKLGQAWNNVDRHMAYELTPYDTTLVMDIDYFCFTDSLLQFMDTSYDFLIPNQVHDLSQRDTFNERSWSMMPMVWATVFVFRKNDYTRKLFDTIKYVKQYYSYFTDMYRIYYKNYRNDYAFAIALQHLNGFIGYDTLPIKLATLPPDCEVLKITDNGMAWKCSDNVDFVEHHDVHVLNKEVANV